MESLSECIKTYNNCIVNVCDIMQISWHVSYSDLLIMPDPERVGLTRYILILLLLIIGGGAYWYFQVYHQGAVSGHDPAIANPASVHCTQDLGGRLEIVNTTQGQVGMCNLPGGQSCEEWDLYTHGTCTPLATTTTATVTPRTT